MAFVKTHCPCDECGSSDGRSYNEDGSSLCFVCEEFLQGDGDMPDIPETNPAKTNEFPKIQKQLAASNYGPLTDRAITAQTCQRYGVLKDSRDNIIISYHDAEDATQPIAAKIRTPQKKFIIHGDWKKAGLFGQPLFGKGGRYITITEGELDALAAYQMQGSKYPVVSIRNGASGALKDCQAAYEWLDSFDNIIVCFDSDAPGQKAAREVAGLFAGKSKVVKMELKDAGEYLCKMRSEDFKNAWWNADVFTPDGIVNGRELWDLVNSPMQEPDGSYPWKALNQITYGIRRAELVTVTAGSGLGKSQFVREIFYHLLKHSECKMGGLFLEENTKKTALSLMSMAANKPLHLPKIEWNDDGSYTDIIPAGTEDELREAYTQTLDDGRVFLFDHFGSMDADNIVSRCRFMIKALGVDVLFVDHISIVVSAQSNGDERKAIDEIMTKLRMLVQETNCMMFLVSHLKRPDGKGHEEGAATSLAQLRGSGSIAQLSDMVIGLERDAQAEDELDRNTTRVRVLKNRFSGETGPVTNLLWDRDTGRMFERDEKMEEAL